MTRVHPLLSICLPDFEVQIRGLRRGKEPELTKVTGVNRLRQGLAWHHIPSDAALLQSLYDKVHLALTSSLLLLYSRYRS